MSVESQVNNIADLNPTYPQADDPVSQGDNHIRNIKKALKDTFPNIDGTVTASEDELNQLVGQDLPSDVGALESRVTKNEGDIANNAAGIANNASAIAANTSRINDVEVIAVNNERELQDKADKSYVDSQNSAQNTVINAKADKTYVDSQDAKKADKTYVDSQDALKADKSNTYTKAEIDVLIEEASKRGGMIKLVTQPSAAGNFTVSSHPQAYMCQLAPSGASFDKSATLSVPQGMVFCFEYLWGFGGSSGDVFIDPEGIYVDGVQLYNVSGGMPPLQYDSTGGPIWPGNDKSAIIRVEQSVEIRRIQATGAGCTVWVAGFFAEA